MRGRQAMVVLNGLDEGDPELVFYSSSGQSAFCV